MPLPPVFHETAATRAAVRAFQSRGETVGFVPTMGALHEGHLSLVRMARSRNDRVFISIFVNPIQFCPGEDFQSYPRGLENDLAALSVLNVDGVFAPLDSTMYPDGKVLTYVIPERLDQNLCGLSRPGHFRGVCTVVAKLFHIVPADEAFLGRKDAQQAAIVRRMVQDLNYPIRVVVCPIVREADGLAMSSRNRYLGPEERAQAVGLFQSLRRAQELLAAGVRDSASIVTEMRRVLRSFPSIRIEYVSIVHPDTLEDLPHIGSKALVAVAARVGRTRLIDNLEADLETGRIDL
ncbi:MAG: pantoate--beta-alanine ligase [Planctomycetes bacterium]|nr:pantoate--beta-alanine ligase [Planctomycetota bacterium]